MNRIGKGLVCGTTGLMSFGAVLASEQQPEITDSQIEACANALDFGMPYRSVFNEIPDACQVGSVNRAFEKTDLDKPHNYYYVLPTSSEFRDRAEDIQQHDKAIAPFRTLAAITVGVVVGGLAYHEWNKKSKPASNQNPGSLSQ